MVFKMEKVGVGRVEDRVEMVFKTEKVGLLGLLGLLG